MGVDINVNLDCGKTAIHDPSLTLSKLESKWKSVKIHRKCCPTKSIIEIQEFTIKRISYKNPVTWIFMIWYVPRNMLLSNSMVLNKWRRRYVKQQCSDYLKKKCFSSDANFKNGFINPFFLRSNYSCIGQGSITLPLKCTQTNIETKLFYKAKPQIVHIDRKYLFNDLQWGETFFSHFIA